MMGATDPSMLEACVGNVSTPPTQQQKKGIMTRQEIIIAVNGEISRLEQVRELLQSSTSEKFTGPSEISREATSDKPKRVLSPEARRRIAQAQKRRWAKQRREAVAS
jgi:hypothetical protein